MKDEDAKLVLVAALLTVVAVVVWLMNVSVVVKPPAIDSKHWCTMKSISASI